jgi:hypothetical protein
MEYLHINNSPSCLEKLNMPLLEYGVTPNCLLPLPGYRERNDDMMDKKEEEKMRWERNTQ